MKKFPVFLRPENVHKLKQYDYTRKLCYLRRHIYETILSSNFSIPEKCSINIQVVQTTHTMGDFFNPTKEMVDQISSELRDNGFTVSLAYGGTVLFLHTGDEPHPEAINCVTFD